MTNITLSNSEIDRTPELSPFSNSFKGEVVDTLGIGSELLSNSGDGLPFATWMGISTNRKIYPDETVADFAQWAEAHGSNHTVVVSDWLNRYNWVAEHGDWDAMHEGSHIESMERNAKRRATILQEHFREQDLGGRVVVWSELLEEIREDMGEISFDMATQTIDHASQHIPEFNADLVSIVKTFATKVHDRSLEAGGSREFIENAMKWYAGEEVLLAALIAATGRANIKIGPVSEKEVDEVTVKYMGTDGYSTEGAYPGIPFGAVHLA